MTKSLYIGKLNAVIKMVHARLVKNIREAVLVVCFLTFTRDNILVLLKKRELPNMLIQRHIIYQTHKPLRHFKQALFMAINRV